MAMRGPRHPIGSAPWVVEERSSAQQIVRSEAEEFTFSARNDVEWLNEHMAEIFSENQMCVSSYRSRRDHARECELWLTLLTHRNVADVFKTPGKLRGRTPRTARKANAGEIRVVCAAPRWDRRDEPNMAGLTDMVS